MFWRVIFTTEYVILQLIIVKKTHKFEASRHQNPKADIKSLNQSRLNHNRRKYFIQVMQLTDL